MINSKNERSRLGKGLVAITFASAVFLSACAGPRATYTPYPTAGTTALEYNADIAECKAWAANQSGASPQRALTKGVEGAVVLGLLGAVLGALAGDARLGGLAGASTGAFFGGISGSQKAQETYDFAYRNCLGEKGYMVR